MKATFTIVPKRIKIYLDGVSVIEVKAGSV